MNGWFELVSQPDAEEPGWSLWNVREPSRFNGYLFGQLAVRLDEDGRGRVRMFPEHRHTNAGDRIHGGALLGFADIALFAIATLQGKARGTGGAVTLDLTMQFLAPGQPGTPCDAVGEVLKETGRLIFVRGLLEQAGENLAAFSGIMRKLPDPRSRGSG